MMPMRSQQRTNEVIRLTELWMAWKWKVMLAVGVLIVIMMPMPWLAPWLYWTANSATQYVPEPPPGVDLNKTGNFNLKVPKIIHHRWNDENVPERWAKVRQRCMDMHPDYQFMLWTEDKERELIKEHFPFFLKTYDHYRYIIQQADVSRYYFLYIHGGMYLDLDVECLRRVDYLLQYDILLPVTWPVGFSNDVLTTPPRHPFFKQITDAAPRWNHFYGTKYPTVMFSTGPMFLTYQSMLYPNRSELWVLPKPLYGKWADSPIAFFGHYYASTWHSEDAAVAVFIWKCKYIILIAGSLGGYLWWRQKKGQAPGPKVA